jgi:predicted AAA+ superfamily ATPase
VLEDTLLLHRIPAWAGSDRASLVAHPKLLFFDLGVRNALLRRPLDRPLDDERGLLLEHLVGVELQRRCGGLWPDARLFHFRTRRGAEVDFVLQRGQEVWAIEVKASRSVDAGDTKGLRAFAERAGRPARSLIVHLGPRRERVNESEAIPLREFLDDLEGA